MLFCRATLSDNWLQSICWELDFYFGTITRSALQELTKREVEYIALSRDTTETDLKQRREIRAGTAFYIDQASAYHTPTHDCLLLVFKKLIFEVEKE